MGKLALVLIASVVGNCLAEPLSADLMLDDGGARDAGPADEHGHDAGPDAHGRRDGGADLDAALADGGALDVDAGALGPRVYIHMRATAAPVPHTAGTSGATPRAYSSGIRSLELLRTADDPSPARIFSYGDGYVEASYDDGADTIVGSAAIADLPTGTFTWARAVHTHVRFTLPATAHTPYGVLPGDLDALLVLSDRTTLDGVARAHGDYRYVFRYAGMALPSEGAGFPIPAVESGGFTMRLEAGETSYAFPVALEVRNDLADDVHVVFEINTHESFRWTEQDAPGYVAGAFDLSALGTEPIVQAGANSYRYFPE